MNIMDDLLDRLDSALRTADAAHYGGPQADPAGRPLTYSHLAIAVAEVVGPALAHLRAENDRLLAYAETMQYHQQKHADAVRELESLRAERDLLSASLREAVRQYLDLRESTAAIREVPRG